MTDIQIGDFVRIIDDFTFFSEAGGPPRDQVAKIRWEVRGSFSDSHGNVLYEVVPEGSPKNEVPWETDGSCIELINDPVTDDELKAVYASILAAGHD